MLSSLGFSLLRRLSDGELHSGEALAAASGISRARVSQVLKEAGAAGLKLERQRGRGYRLQDALPFLARAGRGRRGRGWASVIGGSLTFSLGWRFEQGAGYLSALPLAVGLVLAEALEAEGFADIALKWPNDLLHDGRKLGGILVELSGDALGPSIAVIGVGLNVRLPPLARREIAQPVADLASMAPGRTIDRNALLARIATGLVAMLEAYTVAGFAPLRAAWQRRHALQKKPVQVLLPDGGRVRGEVHGVDADGALVLDSGGRRLRFVSGEVSLRRP